MDAVGEGEITQCSELASHDEIQKIINYILIRASCRRFFRRGGGKTCVIKLCEGALFYIFNLG